MLVEGCDKSGEVGMAVVGRSASAWNQRGVESAPAESCPPSPAGMPARRGDGRPVRELVKETWDDTTTACLRVATEKISA